MIGTWRHRRTGQLYRVDKVVQGKILRIGFAERVWTPCVEYRPTQAHNMLSDRVIDGAVEIGGATETPTYVRELADFMAAFEPVEVVASLEPTMEISEPNRTSDNEPTDPGGGPVLIVEDVKD